MRRPDSHAGFTLIEVVVALAIVAIGMFALFRAVSDATNNSAYLRDRTFASWIAENRIAEIRLSGEFPSVDETEGDVEFAGESWHWKATVSQTPVQGMRRLDVRVRRAEDPADSTLAEITGFLGATLMAGGQSGTSWSGFGGPPAGGEDGGGNPPPGQGRVSR
jgi:general secretion pathway protein I